MGRIWGTVANSANCTSQYVIQSNQTPRRRGSRRRRYAIVATVTYAFKRWSIQSLCAAIAGYVTAYASGPPTSGNHPANQLTQERLVEYADPARR